MVYQLDGKFGPFTLEANDPLQILALQYRLAADHSVYVKSPILIDSNYDHVQFNIEINKNFPNGIGEFIDNNIDALITICETYISGYVTHRIDFSNQVMEIAEADDMEETDSSDIIQMLKENYQNDFETPGREFLSLSNRMTQMLDILKYRKREIEKEKEETAILPVQLADVDPDDNNAAI